MAIKTLRVFQEFTSEGYVPMPVAGNIDYGVTVAGTFPGTTPSTYQTDDPDIDVTVTTMTDFYVWIRSHGAEWNINYTRNVRVYPDSPLINNVVMGIIIANYENALPAGGTTGQILAKVDNTDFNAQWIDNYADWTSQLKHEVKAGVALTKGQAVYVSGADGTNMVVSKASNAAESTSSKTLGLIAQNLALNAKGFVLTEGLLSGLNTSTATIGDPVWLGTNGNLIYGLANKPQTPAHLVFIGFVTRVNANNGEIFVKVQNGFELDELHNVLISTPSNGQALVYDSSSSLWKNQNIASSLTANAPLSIASNVISISLANSTTNGYLSSSDWVAFNSKQGALSLTTSGSSGASTLVGNTLNIPNYSLIGLGGVPTSRTLTINGTTFDLSSDRTWSVGSVTSVGATVPNGFAISGSPITTSGTLAITFAPGYSLPTDAKQAQWDVAYNKRIDTAQMPLQIDSNIISIYQSSPTSNGYLSSTDWSTFNAKQSPLSGTGFVKVNGTTVSYDNTVYTPASRLLTINGTSYDLSADRSWTITPGSGMRNVTSYFATSGQTTFTVTGGYTVGLVDVYINGVRLTSADYTATNGTTIVLGVGAVVNDIVDVVSFTASLTSGVTGSGTSNYIAKWTGSGTIANSQIFDNGSVVGIGTTSPNTLFSVKANASFSSVMDIQNASASGYSAIDFYTNTGTYIGNMGGSSSHTNLSLDSYLGGISFKISGSEKMRLATNGSVGIGTSTPNTYDPSGNNLVVYEAGNAGITIATGATNFGSLFFAREAGTAGAYRGYIEYGQSADYMAFGTVSAERMRITSSGNVGIGTTSPTLANSRAGLVVRGNANGAELLVQSTTATNGSSDGYVIATVGSDAYLYNRLNGFQAFATNNLERMRIASGGQLLVGTTSVNWLERVSISGTASYNGVVRIENNTNTVDVNHGILNLVNTVSYAVGNDAFLMFSAKDSAGTIHPRASIGARTSSQLGADLVFNTRSDSAYTEKMRIASQGAVKLGKSAYTDVIFRSLYIGGRPYDTGYSIINMNPITTDFNGGFDVGVFENGTSGSQYYWIGDNRNGERMRIDANGNVGIGGTAASNFKFYIRGINAANTDFGIVVADINNVTNLYVMNNGTGYLRASSWIFGSDLRMKENIYDVTNGIEMVLKMKPKHFDYINGVKDNIGFIAQDIQKILPQAVSVAGNDGMLGLKTDFLIPYLVKAIQELNAKLEAK
jgi:hypothetical protein